MFGFNLGALRDTVQSVSKKIDSLQAEERALRAERERILHSPASKDDLKALLSDWVMNSGDAYKKSLHETLAKFARNPRNMTPRDLANVMTVTGMAQPFAEAIRPKDVDQALCALFGPLLNEAILKEIDAMDWAPGAISMRERTARAAALQEQIDKLQQDSQKLIAEAEEAGVTWTR